MMGVWTPLMPSKHVLERAFQMHTIDAIDTLAHIHQTRAINIIDTLTCAPQMCAVDTLKHAPHTCAIDAINTLACAPQAREGVDGTDGTRYGTLTYCAPLSLPHTPASYMAAAHTSAASSRAYVSNLTLSASSFISVSIRSSSSPSLLSSSSGSVAWVG